MDGPDHKASLEPSELSAMVAAIRQVEVALGAGVKSPTESEVKNKAAARKSLVASKPIKAGELLSEENISIKRPGVGVSPYRYWGLLNKPATENFNTGDLIVE